MTKETWLDDGTGAGEQGTGLPAGKSDPYSAMLRKAETAGPASTVRETGLLGAHVEEEKTRSILRLPIALATHWRIENELISRGAEADLLLVANTEGQRRVAKIYRAGIEPKTEVLQRVGGSSFEHVVRLFDHGRSDNRSYELLEYVEAGSLEDLIRTEGLRLTEERVLEILLELAKAIHHLHSKGVIHRDVKPSNVLVRTLQPLDLVFTDFGIASVLGDGSQRFTTGSRTIAYAAPETAAGEVSKAADWWSLGIILVEVLTGRHPFAGTQPGELLDDRAIMSRLAQMSVDQLAGNVVDRWQLLCRGLLRRAANNRWSEREIVRWFKRDPTLLVVAETEHNTSALSTFFFAGKNYATLPDIAAVLGSNWVEARKSIERYHLTNWVKDNLRDNELRQFLDDLDRDCDDLDERVFRILLRLDPTAIPVFCGYRLNSEGLIQLANENLAQHDSVEVAQQPTAFILSRLCESPILNLAAERTSIDRYVVLKNLWSGILKEYKDRRDALVRVCSPLGHNLVNSNATAFLLLTVLPGGESVVEKLRAMAVQSATPDAKECPWYRALGDPSTAPASVLLLFIEFAGIAEAEVDAERTRQAEGRRVLQARRRQKSIRIFERIVAAGGVMTIVFLTWIFVGRGYITYGPTSSAVGTSSQSQADILEVIARYPILPGIGMGGLKLGQTGERVKSMLGRPGQEGSNSSGLYMEYDTGNYYLYVYYNRRNEITSFRFLVDAVPLLIGKYSYLDVLSEQKSRLPEVHGITLGSSAADVHSALGRPVRTTREKGTCGLKNVFDEELYYTGLTLRVCGVAIDISIVK